MTDHNASPPITPNYHGQGFVVPRAEFGGDFTPPRVLGGSTESVPKIFDLGTNDNNQTVVTGGVVYCGNQEIEVEELAISNSFSGSVYLKVECESGGFTATLTTTKPTASDTVVYRKLYDVDDGAISLDYRCAPVFVLYN